ncbi:hypothetical protein ANME2D_01496 [Candidatus Methanoperedens nitroreducens]|uniref:Uncharacterized protein n=1 Tax=Candidatus Methanoperedens nitratireducens TaxID=1392998 RepID=A0A062V8L1_9EURY|nr:hypothetical protein ANME2D_01496 [Candidatus Methanoperedens nitroreducens]
MEFRNHAIVLNHTSSVLIMNKAGLFLFETLILIYETTSIPSPGLLSCKQHYNVLKQAKKLRIIFVIRSFVSHYIIIYILFNLYFNKHEQ